MPLGGEDIGTLLVKISADITELKSGLASAKSEIASFRGSTKDTADATKSAWSSIGEGISQVNKSIASARSEMMAFYRVVMVAYGAFRLLKFAGEEWYSIIKAGVEQIDEYRRAIYSTSGLMASISETGTAMTPNMAAAYDQWKEYFAWLYKASLETSRKVSASGKEIFSAGMELSMRGLVPKTADQVLVTGQLVDFIKSVTKGLSPQQQLFQEIRSMFEGAMRLGAQALQKFKQIDPDFEEKFKKAREAAMAMKDATPIWELLAKTMEGTRYASADLATTWTSLVNTGKTVFQMLMMEAFNPMYDSLVKMGWSLVDVIYKNGELTETGRLVALGLGQAWEVVKNKVQEFVQYATTHPREVAEVVGEIAKALGNIALAAGYAAQGIVLLVNQLAQLSQFQGILILIATVLGASFGGVGALIAGLGTAAAVISYNRNSQDKETTEKRAAWVGYKEKPDTESYTDKMARAMDSSGASHTEAPDKAAERRKAIDDQYFPKYKAYKEEELAAHRQGITLIRKRNDIEEAAAKEAKMQYDTEGKKLGAAPPVPDVKMQPPKADKGKKGGGAGRAEDVKEENAAIALARAQRELELEMAENAFKKLKEEDANRFADLKYQYEEGKLTTKEYYDAVRAMDAKEADMAQEILVKKVSAAKAAYAEIIAQNQSKFEKGNIDEPTLNLMNQTEAVKEQIIEQRYLAEIEKERLHKEKQITDTMRQQSKKEEKDKLELLKAEKSTSWGPIAQDNASVAEMRYQYGEKAKNLDEAGKAAWGRLADLKEMEIRYKTEIDGFTNAITGGMEDLVSGMINGSADFKQVANKMFTSIFKSAMEPGLKQLQQWLTDGFRQLFDSLGPGIASAMMGVIGIIGMMLTSTKSSSSFTASGVEKGVTTHESTRGVIAGETSIPIDKISISLKEAMIATNGILAQIEQNTRSMATLKLDISLNVPGIKDAVTAAMEKYFQDMAQTMSK